MLKGIWNWFLMNAFSFASWFERKEKAINRSFKKSHCQLKKIIIIYVYLYQYEKLYLEL